MPVFGYCIIGLEAGIVSLILVKRIVAVAMGDNGGLGDKASSMQHAAVGGFKCSPLRNLLVRLDHPENITPFNTALPCF